MGGRMKTSKTIVKETKENLNKLFELGLLSKAFLNGTINDIDRAIKYKKILEERKLNLNN